MFTPCTAEWLACRDEFRPLLSRLKEYGDLMFHENSIKILLWTALVAASVTFPAEGQTTVSTIIGSGQPGNSDQEVNNPYGVVIGPDGALYFCDLDNQMIRRVDLVSGATTVVAGNGSRGYQGDGGLATAASLNMPHEIQFHQNGDLYIVERDSHVVRRVAVATGIISTVAGTGGPGRSAASSPQHRVYFNGGPVDL